MTTDKGELMGTAEIGERLGVSRARTHQITSSRTFPPPAAILKGGSIWNAEDVEGWIAEHRPDTGVEATGRRVWTVPELHQDLDRYEQALVAAGVPEKTITGDVGRLRRFLRWLAGEYDPASNGA